MLSVGEERLSAIRPVLSLDWLSFLNQEGQVGYRHGDDTATCVPIMALRPPKPAVARFPALPAVL